jgi:drug/metabolite transporter (DMT)-like permease
LFGTLLFLAMQMPHRANVKRRRTSLEELRLSRIHAAGTRRALAATAVSGLLWSVIEIALGGMLRQTDNLIEVVWWRYAVHLLLIGAVWGFSRPKALVGTSRPVFQLARSMLMLTMPAAFVVGLHAGVSPDFMSSVFWTSPALILLLSWWWLDEKPSGLWFALSLAGALASVLIYGHVRTPSFFGVVCASAMQLSFVFYFLMTRALGNERTEANLFYTALGPFVTFGVFMPWVWVTPDLHDATIMTAIGVLGLLALYALDFACHAKHAATGALGLFAQVPAMVTLTYLSYGARLGARAVIGALALFSILLLAWLLASAALPSRTVRR